MRKILSLCCILALLAACGTKGPLVKPPPAALAAAATAPIDNISKPDRVTQ